VTYKLPRITAKDYSGPAGLRQLPASSSLLDLYRYAFEQLASINASSVAAPALTGTLTFDPAARGGAGDAEFAYSGIVMEGLKDGKISSMKSDSFQFKSTGITKQRTGSLTNIAASDVDVGAMVAVFDPRNANDDRDHRVYRQISTGPYVINSPLGMNLRIEGITIDDVGIKPSRMQLPALLAMVPPAGAAPPTPAQARELMEKVANLYEGIRIGNTEMHGLSVETRRARSNSPRCGSISTTARSASLPSRGSIPVRPNGPVKVGRFALRSLDVAGLMRLTAQFSAQKRCPNRRWRCSR